jgi:phosphatidylserine decarboxylase
MFGSRKLTLVYSLVAATFACMPCGVYGVPSGKTHFPIVQELVAELDASPPMRQAFEDSFTLAYATGIDEFKSLDVHSLDDYIDYMDFWLTWVPSEISSGRNVYMHACLFYYIIDLPPIRDWQSPIVPSSKAPWTWLSDWLIRYVKEIGKFMETPESINNETLATFYQSPAYHMEDFPVPEGGWKTFNEFFSRKIDLNKRPVASPGDDTVIVNPADSVFDGWWPINNETADVTEFDVKGLPWTISQLLDDYDFGPKFAGGVFTHSFLSPADYHRQHAPVGGKVVEAKVIPGLCYMEVVLHASNETESGVKLGVQRYMRPSNDTRIPADQSRVSSNTTSMSLLPQQQIDLDVPDRPGFQFIQARGLVLIDNPTLGLVAVLPIGMAQVSSVVLSVKKGDVIEKGDEISAFHLGGSDVVIVFQKEANVQFTQELGTHYDARSILATGGKKN